MTDPDTTAAPDPRDEAAARGLVDALETLRARLGALRLPLETPGVGAARADLHQAVDQLDDYLLPRLRAERAPLLVVVGGSTGAGKSTLVNSLLGEPVSAPGVLRPTTRAPVLVHHPLDARWFTTDRVLPGLARVTSSGRLPDTPPTGAPGASDRSPAPTHASDVGRTGVRGTPDTSGAEGAAALRLVASEALPQGLALLDAPDIDSVETANRELSAQLLGAADLWLFVTTAARYADAVPWDLLGQAARRRAQVAIVLDRVDPGAEVVADDLRRMTVEHGLGDARVFVLGEAAEQGPGALVDGLLPEAAVAEVATWLSGLGGDPEARARVIAATRDGVVDDLVRRAVALAETADGQEVADARLRDAVRRYHAEALEQVEVATSDGALLRGEVLARWQDFVGTGEFFRSVEAGVGRVRDAVVRFFRGRPKEAPQVEQAIAHGLESVILDAAEQAAERTFAAWRSDGAGAALLDGLDLARVPAALRTEVAEQIRGWQEDVLALVREQGESRRGTARAVSFGVNALGVSLMVIVFASTAGLTGAEDAERRVDAAAGRDGVHRRGGAGRVARRVLQHGLAQQRVAHGVEGLGDPPHGRPDDLPLLRVDRLPRALEERVHRRTVERGPQRRGGRVEGARREPAQQGDAVDHVGRRGPRGLLLLGEPVAQLVRRERRELAKAELEPGGGAGQPAFQLIAEQRPDRLPGAHPLQHAAQLGPAAAREVDRERPLARDGADVAAVRRGQHPGRHGVRRAGRVHPPGWFAAGGRQVQLLHVPPGAERRARRGGRLQRPATRGGEPGGPRVRAVRREVESVPDGEPALVDRRPDQRRDRRRDLDPHPEPVQQARDRLARDPGRFRRVGHVERHLRQRGAGRRDGFHVGEVQHDVRLPLEPWDRPHPVGRGEEPCRVVVALARVRREDQTLQLRLEREELEHRRDELRRRGPPPLVAHLVPHELQQRLEQAVHRGGRAVDDLRRHLRVALGDQRQVDRPGSVVHRRDVHRRRRRRGEGRQHRLPQLAVGVERRLLGARRRREQPQLLGVDGDAGADLGGHGARAEDAEQVVVGQ
ncbi:dynamin family protein, partial [Isoptericola sp. QY 916]|uniref:dynamin family protein n=1 Tax=Isoptericola sp. QY 916 TaxID=2782570 RepID=UPI003D2FA10B